MRTARHVTMLSLALAVGACGTRSDRTAALPDDLKQDLAAAAASSGEFATAPQSYQPMRFVSAVERSRTGAPAKRIAMTHHHVKAAVSRRPTPDVASNVATDAMDMTVAEAPTPVSTPEASVAEPTIVHQPASEPANGPSAAPVGAGGEVGSGDRGHGGGWGGLLGGIAGAVIRGGIVGVDKCDPRTDGRAHPTVIDRPVFGLPVPTGQPTFPRMPRR